MCFASLHPEKIKENSQSGLWPRAILPFFDFLLIVVIRGYLIPKGMLCVRKFSHQQFSPSTQPTHTKKKIKFEQILNNLQFQVAASNYLFKLVIT